jgi:hypothetical protein
MIPWLDVDEIGLRKFGATIQMVGSLYQGEDKLFLLFFPGEAYEYAHRTLLRVEVTDWQAFLLQTDAVETEVTLKDENGVIHKAFLRKSERRIEAKVTWDVFRRDGYRCRYCGNDKTPLTVDHVITWESGGPSTEENMVSACRKCNGARGDMPYEQWLVSHRYLHFIGTLSPDVREANEVLVQKLATIPRRTFHKSR